MAKKFHNSEHYDDMHQNKSKDHSNMPTDLKIEDWTGPVPGMPEDSYNDSFEGIDEQINKDNIKHSKIKPRKA